MSLVPRAEDCRMNTDTVSRKLGAFSTQPYRGSSGLVYSVFAKTPSSVYRRPRACGTTGVPCSNSREQGTTVVWPRHPPWRQVEGPACRETWKEKGAEADKVAGVLSSVNHKGLCQGWAEASRKSWTSKIGSTKNGSAVTGSLEQTEVEEVVGCSVSHPPPPRP